MYKFKYEYLHYAKTSEKLHTIKGENILKVLLSLLDIRVFISSSFISNGGGWMGGGGKRKGGVTMPVDSSSPVRQRKVIIQETHIIF